VIWTPTRIAATHGMSFRRAFDNGWRRSVSSIKHGRAAIEAAAVVPNNVAISAFLNPASEVRRSSGLGRCPELRVGPAATFAPDFAFGFVEVSP
jgi:hypothetical protein